MDYPATQMFVNDDDDEKDEDEEKTEEEAGTPLRAEKNVKIGVLIVDPVTYPIHKGINRVGRIYSCSVVIDHNTISKEHAEIEAGLGSKSTFISDLGSLNKTKLNDIILRPGRLYQLQDGDVVRFGSVRAVFKVEDNKAEKAFDRSTNRDGFVIPETPAPITKEMHPIIPGTPDLSSDRSLTDGNRSSDVSMISETQEVRNRDGRSSPFLCRGPLLFREIPCGGVNLDLSKDDTTEMSNRQDITEMETQKNFSVVDSDEENIFDMITQKSDIHDDETQRFSTDNIHVAKPSRNTVDKPGSHSSSIEDLETQKFSNDDDKIESRSCSINDLETQKFPLGDSAHGSGRAFDESESRFVTINNLETQKFPLGDVANSSNPTVDGIESHLISINDIEAPNFPIDDVTNGSHHSVNKIESFTSYSINDVETQKPETLDKDNEDSETDEEGIFENSDDGVVDMFDAPTQLIKAPREASRSPCENLESGGNVKVKNVAKKDEIIQERIVEPEENNEENRIQVSAEVETRVDLKINEKTSAQLNDSIESNLNHMFDDVNETTVDEPTQILTQHLEKILESTQAGDIPKTENVNSHFSKIPNCDGTAIDSKSGEANDDDNTANSDDGKTNEPVKVTPKKASAAVIRVPEILSTQELFGDLPAVNIFGTPSAGSRRGRIKVSPLSDIAVTPRSKKSEKFETESSTTARDTEGGNLHTGRNKGKNRSNNPKRAGSTESDESVDLKRSKSMKDTKSKVSKSGVASVEENRTPSRANGRKKPKIQMEVVSPASSAGNLEEVNAKVEEPMKAVSRKGLPLKKRGSSILSSPPTPQKTAEEVIAPTARVSTRSNVKISVESEKRSTCLSAVDSPKIPGPKRLTSSSMIKVNNEKPESPTLVLPAKTEPSNRNKKGTRLRKIDDADPTLQAEVKPPSMYSSRSSSRRLRKKPLDTSAAVSNEEVTPVKRLKTSTTALPSTVSDRPRPAAQREKRKKTNSRELNGLDSSDLEINQSESLPTRRRRTRPPIITSPSDSSKNSSMAVENLAYAVHQPSLESQEVEAILGAVDQRDNEAREVGVSRYRKEIRRVFRTHLRGNDFRKDDEDRTSSRQGFTGFPNTKQEDEDRFEKPVGKPERRKRQLPQPNKNNDEYYDDDDDDDDDDDLTETNKKRPKPRGKKNADAVNQDNLLRGESSGVTVPVGSVRSSSVKSHSKVSKNEKIVVEKIKVPDPPPRVIVAEEAPPKGQTTTPVRNKRGVSRRVVDRAGKENVVDEPAPKRGRRRVVDVKPEKPNSSVLLDDEAKVSQSSSPLRRGRSSLVTPTSSATSSARIKHRILFTGLNDTRLVSIVNNLGGTVTEKPNDCTALVTDKVRRTFKFLCGMAMAVPIVSVDWLKESERKGLFLDTGDFLLEDPVEEAKFKFSLRRSLAMATDHRLLEGYTVVLTPNTAPPPIAEMKGIIQACGGKALVRPPTSWPEKSLIISRQEDVKHAKKISTKAPKLVHLLSVEFILTGILRHELNFDEHKLQLD